MDDSLITQNGQPRLATLEAFKAFALGGGNTGSVLEILTVTTPGPQVAGAAFVSPFVLRDTYTNIAPSGLDTSLDGGATWMPATSSTIGNGAFSFSLVVLTANPAQTVQVRDNVAQAITATSGAFAVAAPVLVESAEGTVVTTVRPTIIDAAENIYSISPAGYVVTNGDPETTISANVVEIAHPSPRSVKDRAFTVPNAQP